MACLKTTHVLGSRSAILRQRCGDDVGAKAEAVLQDSAVLGGTQYTSTSIGYLLCSGDSRRSPEAKNTREIASPNMYIFIFVNARPIRSLNGARPKLTGSRAAPRPVRCGVCVRCLLVAARCVLVGYFLSTFCPVRLVGRLCGWELEGAHVAPPCLQARAQCTVSSCAL